MREYEILEGEVSFSHRGERHFSAAGGGYGDPRKRDRNSVPADVRNGKVSAQAAREVYGLSES